jgi:hypothetical protein
MAGFTFVSAGCANTNRSVCARSNQPPRTCNAPSAVAMRPCVIDARKAVASSPPACSGNAIAYGSACTPRCGFSVGKSDSPQYAAFVTLPFTYPKPPVTLASNAFAPYVAVVRSSPMPATPGTCGALEKRSYGVFGASGKPAMNPAASGPTRPGPFVD